VSDVDFGVVATSPFPVVGYFDAVTLVEQFHWRSDSDDGTNLGLGVWTPTSSEAPRLDPPTHGFRLRTFDPNGGSGAFTSTTGDPFALKPPLPPDDDGLPQAVWMVRRNQVLIVIPAGTDTAVVVAHSEWQLASAAVQGPLGTRFTDTYWYQVLHRSGNSVAVGKGKLIDERIDWDGFSANGDEVSSGTLSVTDLLGPTFGPGGAHHTQLGIVGRSHHQWLLPLASIVPIDPENASAALARYPQHDLWSKVFYDAVTVGPVGIAVGAHIDTGLFLVRTDGTTPVQTVLDSAVACSPTDALFFDRPGMPSVSRLIYANQADDYMSSINKSYVVDARLARYDMALFDGDIYLTTVIAEPGRKHTATELCAGHQPSDHRNRQLRGG
jgi:hypothetical protein